MKYNIVFDGTKVTIHCYCYGALLLCFGESSFKLEVFPNTLFEFDCKGCTSIDFVCYE